MLDLVNVNEMKKLTKDNDIMNLRILFLTVSKATTIRNISYVIIYLRIGRCSTFTFSSLNNLIIVISYV